MYSLSIVSSLTYSIVWDEAFPNTPLCYLCFLFLFYLIREDYAIGDFLALYPSFNF